MGASARTFICCHACLVKASPGPAEGMKKKPPNRQKATVFSIIPYSKSRGDYIRKWCAWAPVQGFLPWSREASWSHWAVSALTFYLGFPALAGVQKFGNPSGKNLVPKLTGWAWVFWKKHHFNFITATFTVFAEGRWPVAKWKRVIDCINCHTYFCKISKALRHLRT